MDARAAAATPGPWESFVEAREPIGGSDFIRTGGMDDASPDMYVMHSHWEGPPGLVQVPAADLDFIASAREDVPRLVAEVRRLRALHPPD